MRLRPDNAKTACRLLSYTGIERNTVYRGGKG